MCLRKQFSLLARSSIVTTSEGGGRERMGCSCGEGGPLLALARVRVAWWVGGKWRHRTIDLNLRYSVEQSVQLAAKMKYANTTREGGKFDKLIRIPCFNWLWKKHFFLPFTSMTTAAYLLPNALGERLHLSVETAGVWKCSANPSLHLCNVRKK